MQELFDEVKRILHAGSNASVEKDEDFNIVLLSVNEAVLHAVDVSASGAICNVH